MSSIQSALALPELKRTETRQALADTFELYREYKMILAMGGNEPSITQNLPHSLDMDGLDPDLVRAPGKVSSSTLNNVIRNEHMQKFIDRIDRAVNKMYPVRREIIRRKFLCEDDDIPTDGNVHEALNKSGYAMSFKKYELLKAKSLWALAFALGIEKYESAELQNSAEWTRMSGG